MKPTQPNRLIVAISLSTLALLTVHCDRGVEAFDPAEEPARPNLDRIYPKGAQKAGSPGAGMGMGAAGLPEGPARRDSPNQAAAAEMAVGPTISGTIVIDEALYGAQPANAMLFIIARKQPTGPPLAVLRIPGPSFPLAFELSQAQVMIPTLKFEGEVKLSARLDSDGNAMTKLPGDLVGEVSTVVPVGSSGVMLLLDGKL